MKRYWLRIALGILAWLRRALCLCGSMLASTSTAAESASAVHMFGYGPGRNMVNLTEKNVPTEWDVAGQDQHQMGRQGRLAGLRPDRRRRQGLRRHQQQYPRNPRDTRKRKDGKTEPIDKSVLLCFDAATGKFLWQHVNDKLPSGQVHDWPEEGICSSPAVEGNRLYYVSNRCEVVCLDTNGFADGNQGVHDEKYKEPTDADVIWRLDMMKELNVFPHNLAACSPLLVGDTLYVVTANGVDENHENIPSPRRPELHRRRQAHRQGEVEEQRPGPEHHARPVVEPGLRRRQRQAAGHLPRRRRLAPRVRPGHRQGHLGVRRQPEEGAEVRTRRQGRPQRLPGHAGRRTTNKLYIGTGQDPEHVDGVGHLWCIDLTKTGDISPELVDQGRPGGPDQAGDEAEPEQRRRSGTSAARSRTRPRPAAISSSAGRSAPVPSTTACATPCDLVGYLLLPGREDGREALGPRPEDRNLGLAVLGGRQSLHGHGRRRHVDLQARPAEGGADEGGRGQGGEVHAGGGGRGAVRVDGGVPVRDRGEVTARGAVGRGERLPRAWPSRPPHLRDRFDSASAPKGRHNLAQGGRPGLSYAAPSALRQTRRVILIARRPMSS